MYQIMIKSFGLGIMSVEIVSPDINPGDAQEEMRKMVDTMFDVQEWIFPEKLSRAIIMTSEGHAPSKYELSQFEDSDWDELRSDVSANGSQEFKERLVKLETCIRYSLK